MDIEQAKIEFGYEDPKNKNPTNIPEVEAGLAMLTKEARKRSYVEITRKNIKRFEAELTENDIEVFSRSDAVQIGDGDEADYVPLTPDEWFGEKDINAIAEGLRSKKLWDALSRKKIVADLADLFEPYLEEQTREFTREDMKILDDIFVVKKDRHWDEDLEEHVGVFLFDLMKEQIHIVHKEDIPKLSEEERKEAEIINSYADYMNEFYEKYRKDVLGLRDQEERKQKADSVAGLFGISLRELSEENKNTLDEILDEAYPYIGNRLAS